MTDTTPTRECKVSYDFGLLSLPHERAIVEGLHECQRVTYPVAVRVRDARGFVNPKTLHYEVVEVLATWASDDPLGATKRWPIPQHGEPGHPLDCPLCSDDDFHFCSECGRRIEWGNEHAEDCATGAANNILSGEWPE